MKTVRVRHTESIQVDFIGPQGQKALLGLHIHANSVIPDQDIEGDACTSLVLNKKDVNLLIHTLREFEELMEPESCEMTEE